MADDRLAEHAELLELFFDSGSEDEFEAFQESDIGNHPNATLLDEFTMDGWEVGDREPPDLPFHVTPGLTDEAKDRLPPHPEPVNYFDLFLRQSDFEIMANETNRYADAYMEKNRATLKPHSRFRSWKNTTWQEMQVFVAMIIAMGLTVQLTFTEYWTTDEVTETPFYRKLMSRDRALLLMSFYHLADNALFVRRGLPGFDPLHKLGAVYRNIVSRFPVMYKPQRHLSLDEGMIPWRGHLSFRVYSPDKPNKYGIKVYMLCDALSGYCLKFNMYAGKSIVPISMHGITYDLVMDMMSGYFGQGYILYMDNYYSGVQLAWDLWNSGVGTSGTIRKSRMGIPDSVIRAECKEKGSTHVEHNKYVMLMKYCDRNMVYMISTVHKATPVETRRIDPQTRQPIQRPQVVAEYDKYMGGVDHSDQMISYATMRCRTLKWWKRVIFHMFSLAALNAYLLYKSHVGGASAMLSRDFRKKLVKQLVSRAGGTRVSTTKPGPAETDTLLRLQDRKHCVVKIDPTGVKRNVTHTCVVCGPAEKTKFQHEHPGEKRRRYGRETSYKCHTCQKALCPDKCFYFYHYHQDYESKYLASTYGSDSSDDN